MEFYAFKRHSFTIDLDRGKGNATLYRDAYYNAPGPICFGFTELQIQENQKFIGNIKVGSEKSGWIETDIRHLKINGKTEFGTSYTFRPLIYLGESIEASIYIEIKLFPKKVVEFSQATVFFEVLHGYPLTVPDPESPSAFSDWTHCESLSKIDRV